MSDTRERTTRRLPVLRFGDEEYFIDNRLDEFRTVTPPVRPIEFVRFESVNGLRMLNECLWYDCERCGRMMAVSRQSRDAEIRCCDCGGRVPIRIRGEHAPGHAKGPT